MTDGIGEEYCPLCGEVLSLDTDQGSVCPSCSFNFIEQDGVLIFDFRDLDYRAEYDKRFKKALVKVQDKVMNHSADILSEFLKKDVKIGKGTIKTFDIEDPDPVFSKDGLTFASFSRLKGRVAGTLLIMVPPDSVAKITGIKDKRVPLGSDQGSTIIEMGTLLTSSICDRFATEFETKVDMTPPFLVVDMPSAILNYIISEFSQVEEDVDYYKIGLSSENDLKIDLLFFPHPSTKDIFVSSLK